MSNSRIQNTKRNIFSGAFNLLINSLLTFVNTTIIIYSLGADYNGLSNLFGSILQVLCLAEFGFGMVVVYYLYEPLANNDTDAINRIMSWMRKVYHIVGGVILCGGLLTTPFITHFIHGSYPESINIYILFLIYLLNSGISYFLFAYKEVLLIADQKRNIISNISSGVRIIVNILQILALLIFRNYYLFAGLLIFGTVLSNLMVNRAIQKRYPYLTNVKNTEKLPLTMKKELVGLMINRLSNVSRNAFDNMIISSTLGLIANTIYGNYYQIYTAVFSATGMISSSMQASVGNSMELRSKEENFENMLDFSLLYSWIVGWCTVTLACLYQPFMLLWVGEELMLSERDMLLFAVYFYFINMNHIRNQYLFGKAFWWKLKWAYLAESIGNLLLNIVLGKLFGITGVLIATILTIFFCNYLMCNHVLFKNYFTDESILTFYKQQFYYLLAAAAVTAVTYMICRTLDSIFIRALICLVLPNIMFFILYLPCSRRKSSMAMVKRILKSR